MFDNQKHGASGNGCKESPDQSKTGFKLIFDHQNFMCEDIRHIGRDMTQNRIFGNGGTFCPSLPFWTILSKQPAYNWLFMLFDHQNMGIDTSYVEISVQLVKQ